ncbi:hypothetical protein [Jeotgalibacillus marinus]|uniref:Bulb-type lectin domain-containing protein n=1 Tax=Jeotgalibacillus marinus TaxID=86667 RepID=A0ABV3Q6B5_9BACL
MKTFSLLTKLVLTTLLFLSAFIPNQVSASTENVELDILNIEDIDVNPDRNYARGNNPSISVLDNGLVIAIKDYQGKLSYQLGEYKNEQLYWTYPEEYDTGQNPSVTVLDNGHILEVHDTGSGRLFYNLGRYEDGKIIWYRVGKQYDTGRRPDLITLSNGVVMEVHEGQLFGGGYYTFGRYDETYSTMNWFNVGNRYGGNIQETVIAQLHDGDIINVAEEFGRPSHIPLFYRIGSIGSYSISWSPKTQYDNGYLPSIAVLLSGHILEVHTGNSTDAWYRLGKREGDEINWYTLGGNYSKGQNNDLAVLYNGVVVDVHEDGNGTLWYNLGRQEGDKMVWF